MEKSKNNSYDNSSIRTLEKLRPQRSVENISQKRREIFQGFNKADFVALQRCYLCESTKIEQIFDKEGFGYFQCKKCEFLFQNPRLKKEKYYRAYCESEFAKMYHEQIHFKNFELRKEKVFKNKLKYLPLIFKQSIGNLLDVGSADGGFLEVVKEANSMWKCIGVEPNKHAGQYAQNMGVNIFQGYFEDYNEEPSTFDYITMWGVLPYLYDLNALISKCYKLLKKKGRLIISNPNNKGFESIILKKHHTDVGADGLHYFDTQNIQLLLRKFGFKNIAIETPGKYDIEFVEQRCKTNPELIGMLDEFTRYVIFGEDEEIKNSFQSFLSDNRLSNHMIAVAVK